MNILYKIQFGVELDRNVARINNKLTKEPLEQLLRDVAEHFGGFTLVEGKGGYVMSETGTFVVEYSSTLEILGSESQRELILEVAKDLKDIFNQESVLLSETKINSVFV